MKKYEKEQIDIYKLPNIHGENDIVYSEEYIKVFWPKDDDYDYSLGMTLLAEIPKRLNSNERTIIRYVPFDRQRKSWRFELVRSIENDITVSTCPNMIGCSLNTFEHPDKRKWWLNPHGLEGMPGEYISYELYSDHEIDFDYYDLHLYYRLTAMAVYQSGTIASIDELEKRVSFILRNQRAFPLKENDIAELHTNFLRDMLKLW